MLGGRENEIPKAPMVPLQAGMAKSGLKVPGGGGFLVVVDPLALFEVTAGGDEYSSGTAAIFSF